jgi:hypothetical protein
MGYGQPALPALRDHAAQPPRHFCRHLASQYFLGRDEHAGSSPNLNQSFPLQRRIGCLNGARISPHLERQLADAGESVTGMQLTGVQPTHDAIAQLIDQFRASRNSLPFGVIGPQQLTSSNLSAAL